MKSLSTLSIDRIRRYLADNSERLCFLEKSNCTLVCGFIAVPTVVTVADDRPCKLTFCLQSSDGKLYRYFQQEGGWCWGAVAWDGALTEVYPETKTITVFTTKKDLGEP